MGNGPNRNRWYIDGLPSYKMVISHGDLLNNQMEYIYIWVNYNDLTATIIIVRENDPQMAELFRLVKYNNLPRILWGI